MIAKIPITVLVASLKSTKCPACGGSKQAGHSLCRTDFGDLSYGSRQRLYHQIGSGYEGAMNKALESLGVSNPYWPEAKG